MVTISMMLPGLIAEAVLLLLLAAAVYAIVAWRTTAGAERVMSGWALRTRRYELERHLLSSDLDRDEVWLVMQLVANVDHFTSPEGSAVTLRELDRMRRDQSRKRLLFIRKVARVLRQTHFTWLREEALALSRTIGRLGSSNTTVLDRLMLALRRAAGVAEESVRLLYQPPAQVIATA
jgi:hypothetical protein